MGIRVLLGESKGGSGGALELKKYMGGHSSIPLLIVVAERCFDERRSSIVLAYLWRFIKMSRKQRDIQSPNRVQVATYHVREY